MTERQEYNAKMRGRAELRLRYIPNQEKQTESHDLMTVVVKGCFEKIAEYGLENEKMAKKLLFDLYREAYAYGTNDILSDEQYS